MGFDRWFINVAAKANLLNEIRIDGTWIVKAFEAYKLYVALKLHFTDDNYDYFKYNGHVKADAHSFESRRDRYFFEKLAKHTNPRDFLLANLVSGQRSYIRDLAYGDEAKKTYSAWLRVKESLTYVFTEDLSNLKPNLKDNFVCPNNQHPYLLKLYLGGHIKIETLSILCDITGCLRVWDNKLEGDPIYHDVGMLVKKYIPFLNYDKEKFKSIIRNKFKEA